MHFCFVIFSVILCIQQFNCDPNPPPSTASSWFGQAASYLPTGYFTSTRPKVGVTTGKVATKPAVVTKPKGPENVANGGFAQYGVGMLNNLKNGGAWGNLMNSGKGVMGYLPLSEQMRSLAANGVNTANVKGTLQNYVSQYPLAAELLKYIEMAEKISQAASYLNGGFTTVKNMAFTSTSIMEAVVVGRAVMKGVQVYVETGDLSKAVDASNAAGLKSAADVINGVPGAKMDAGNNIKAVENLIKSGKEAVNSMTMSEQMKYFAMIGISAAEAVKEGKSINEIITEYVKGTLLDYATKHPVIKELMKYVEWIKGSWLFA